jgi:hypothetical protein
MGDGFANSSAALNHNRYGFGEDVLRTHRVSFDLSQLAYVHPQILGIGAVTPQFMQYQAVRQHFAGVLQQHAQEIEFLRRQLRDLLAAQRWGNRPAQLVDS